MIFKNEKKNEVTNSDQAHKSCKEYKYWKHDNHGQLKTLKVVPGA